MAKRVAIASLGVFAAIVLGFIWLYFAQNLGLVSGLPIP